MIKCESRRESRAELSGDNEQADGMSRLQRWAAFTSGDVPCADAHLSMVE